MNSRDIVKQIIKDNPGITIIEVARLSKLDPQVVLDIIIDLGAKDELTFIREGFGLVVDVLR